MPLITLSPVAALEEYRRLTSDALEVALNPTETGGIQLGEIFAELARIEPLVTAAVEAVGVSWSELDHAKQGDRGGIVQFVIDRHLRQPWARSFPL
jgi:hypothetical protein